MIIAVYIGVYAVCGAISFCIAARYLFDGKLTAVEFLASFCLWPLLWYLAAVMYFGLKGWMALEKLAQYLRAEDKANG